MSLSLAAMQNLTANVVVDFDRKVASGGYGDVYKGRLTRNVDGYVGKVAVKVTRFFFENVPERIIMGIKQELDIWQQHRHPYILPLIGAYLHEGLPCAVSPWCNSGTILQYMKSARQGHEPELDAPVTNCNFDLLRLHCLEIELLSQVAAGLAYLHAKNLAHGDIKASNILVKGGVAQLGDFGFSVSLAEHTGRTSSHLGTARWFAPESLEEHSHRTQEADIWAFGCVILEVRTLLVPYHRVPEPAVPLAIRKDLPFERPKDIHPSLWGMAEVCWSRSPKTRMTSPDLVSHIEITLKYATLLREALGALSDIRLLALGYPNSNSRARLSLAAFVSRRDKNRFPDLILAVSTARNALHPQLAEQVILKLATPGSLGSPLRGHTSTVYSVAFLSDGLHVVSSSWDMTLHIWDIGTGQMVISPLKGHSGTVPCIAAHGSRIASCSYDGTFRLWDASSGKKILGPITAHDGKYVEGIAYSRDGTCIATGGGNNRATLWDANTGVHLCEMAGHTNWVMCVAFSEDGTRLASGSKDTTVRIWDIVSGKCIGEPLTGHTSWVHAVCFSRDDKRIFSSSADRTIRVWDAETRALIFDPLKMDHRVLSMALSPDGNRLVSGSDTGRIAMWDAESGAAIPIPFQERRERVWSLAFSPDGRTIASASLNNVALWDTTDDWRRYELGDDAKHLVELLKCEIPPVFSNEDLLALSTLTGSHYGRATLCSIHADVGFRDRRATALRLLASLSVQLAHDGSLITHSPSAVDSANVVITTIEALKLRLPPLDLRPVARALLPHDINLTGGLMEKLSTPEIGSPLRGHTYAVSSVAFLPDSHRLVSSSQDGTVRIWDTQTGETVIGPLEGHTSNVLCVAVHGSRITSCSYDGTFRVWDADSGELILGPITAHDSKDVHCIAYSRDGTQIATAGEDNRAAIWDANTGAALHEMVGHTDWVMCVAFSEDGTRLASGSKDTTVRIWDVVSGERIGEPLTGHKDWVHAVSFSRDGRRIFSSSGDETIRIWDAETRALIVEPLRMDETILSMALSPDGKRLVSGSWSGKIAMWDAETGAAIQTPFRDHGAPVWGLAFSPDGRKIASASKDKTIALWDATDDWKRYDIDDEDA
ncbi:WD40 repeat-like protein [Exidia glandulosa HHB12029]|uniref:WD40 repeat-like protein n=1 Tax=Exidia glandulosa HHB12029 TaxID=1314781 RepID=A0A166APC1_EXIGL|nr:WD40 repeat-like protein [Exidia glandulosa HHB12029]